MANWCGWRRGWVNMTCRRKKEIKESKKRMSKERKDESGVGGKVGKVGVGGKKESFGSVFEWSHRLNL